MKLDNIEFFEDWGQTRRPSREILLPKFRLKKRCYRMDNRVLGVLLGITLVFGTTHLFGRNNQALVAAGNQAALAKLLNIKSYGAIGDGVAMETEAIQKTIDACHAAGGGIVWIPPGDFQIGTIWLKSNITLSLDYGAGLLGSHNIADYRTEGLSNPREGGPQCGSTQ